jgi:hypothetical protein
MRKQTPNLEWQIAESEAEWEHQQAQRRPEVTPANSGRLRQQRDLWCMATLLLLLVGTGEWWQRSTAASLQVAETDAHLPVQQIPLLVVTSDRDGLTTMIRDGQTSADWKPNASGWKDYGWEYSGLPAPTPIAALCASSKD